MNGFAQDRLRPLAPGIFLALLAIALGFGLGGIFGAAEDSIKGRLKGDAAAVLEPTYGGDQAAADKVTSKSWAYLKRSHLHAGVLGTAALSMILLLALLGKPGLLARGSAVVLGFGAVVYGLFWLFAGFRAPGMGSTGVAKESLQWLAVPGAGACLLGLLGPIGATRQALYFGGRHD